MSHTNTADEIITFWFSEPVKRLWYSTNPAFERLLRVNYLNLYRAACNHALDHWGEEAEGSLALTIILDQFPLHMFRDEEESFENEESARAIARNAINKGQDNELKKFQKGFIYTPFMHSESMEDQLYAIKLFEDAELIEHLKYAQQHHDIIKRFGRFPQRNRALGRISTTEEKEYLKSKEDLFA
jgi:uncharacterized protein (DUF924 family)